VSLVKVGTGTILLEVIGIDERGRGAIRRVVEGMAVTVRDPEREGPCLSAETGSQSQSTGVPIPFAAVGAKIPFEFVFSAAASTPIGFTNTTTNSPTYGFHLRLEAL
jgi:hypothetical protein